MTKSQEMVVLFI